MTLLYNIEPQNIDLEITQGDNFIVDITAIYPLLDGQIDMHVRYFDDRNVRELSSVPSPGCITWVGQVISIDCDPFDEVGIFRYDIQIQDIYGTHTIIYGLLKVNKKQ